MAKSRSRSKKAVKATNAARANGKPLHGTLLWRGRTQAGCSWEILRGDAREVMRSFDDGRFKCVITSPPYYSQRDYQVDGQIGLEKTIQGYVNRIVATFEEVKRVMASDGSLFLNLGDTYYSGKGQPKGRDKKNVARRMELLRPVDASGLGVPKKTIIGIPWRVAIAMIDKGWTLRCPIVWSRDTSLPEPTAHDRPWKSYEMVFLFTKERTYHFDRAKLNGEEDIWRISNRPRYSKGVHPASFPDELVQKCLDVGCPPKGEVLDPFAGSGTVVRVALASHRPAVGIDLNEKFCKHIVHGIEQL